VILKKFIAPMLLLLAPLPTLASQYDDLYVFGDSLSDTHNEYNAIGLPMSPPYDNGRWSNGPVWVEDLAPKLGLTFNPSTDYAVGAATTGALDIDSASLPGMQTQVANYLAAHPVADPNGLYIVWGGANDYGYDVLNNITPNPAQVVQNLAGEIDLLAAHGAQHFLIPNLGDLGALPFTNDLGIPGLPTEATQITLAHNALLAGALANLQSLFPNDQFTSLDIYSLFQQITADPMQYGFADVSHSYLAYAAANPGTLVGPNSFLFYDELHPTAAGHELIGNAAFAALTPEPGSVGLLAGLVSTGAAVGLRQRRRARR
jgi:phospholipase/lecithinase/hemolysin